MSNNVRRFVSEEVITHRVNRQDVRTVCLVDVEIDLGSIFTHLGHKAIHNKSKRTKALRGDIVVKVKPLGPAP